MPGDYPADVEGDAHHRHRRCARRQHSVRRRRIWLRPAPQDRRASGNRRRSLRAALIQRTHAHLSSGAIASQTARSSFVRGRPPGPPMPRGCNALNRRGRRIIIVSMSVHVCEHSVEDGACPRGRSASFDACRIRHVRWVARFHSPDVVERRNTHSPAAWYRPLHYVPPSQGPTWRT